MVCSTNSDEENQKQRLCEQESSSLPNGTQMWNAILAPGCLWYAVFLAISSLLIHDLHAQWLLLNLGLAGSLYWVVAQLLLKLPNKSQAILLASLVTLGGATGTCWLATALFYHGGNPCHFFPGVYYYDRGVAHQKYYTLDETQECQSWVTITYLSSLFWAGLIAPLMVWLVQRDEPSSLEERE